MRNVFPEACRRPLAPLALFLALLAPALPPAAQENPMSVTTYPVEDDEPEAATEPPAPQAGAPLNPAPGSLPLPPRRPGTPAVAVGPTLIPLPRQAGRAIQAPLPPQRAPGAEEPAEELPAEPAAPAAPETAANAPAPRAPAPAPVPNPNPDRPDLIVAFAPPVAEEATTEEIEAEEARTPEPTNVEKQTDAVDIACLKPEVMSLIREAGEHFGGTPIITSGSRNRGRRGSLHRRCMAADFFVPGIERARLARYLRGLTGAGGVGTYCHTKSVHVDIGEPRNWYQCGRRFRFAQR